MAMTALPEITDTSAMYLSVQQFYARHMHLLDSGRAREWADTFAPDGTFTAPGLDAPVRGREALAAAVEQTHARLAATGETHRHWHGMVWVTPAADGRAHVRCYGMVIAVTADGTPRLHRHCLCEDTLIPAPAEPEGWLVQSRHVTPDAAPPAAN
ncbi:nuclear transport factor 2 family protein [Catellatospora sichuanensis]|uniref:nuclear transport factor 2 family protein n=1 Tax=Catellatospora sichuanensis TaxID=1969805 RepID=UPI001FE65D96|nr:nuclear transport factor 2 family protein [Catellatospora sichuanensis]